MRAMRISNPQMRAIADQMEQDEVVRWASTLARARVTRWGGMISTPDAMLQVRLTYSKRNTMNPTVRIGTVCTILLVHYLYFL